MDFREIGAPGCSGASILLTRLQSRIGKLPSSAPPLWCFGTASSTELCRASGQDVVQSEGSDPDTSQGAPGSFIPMCHEVSAHPDADPSLRDSTCRDILLWVLALLAFHCFGGAFFPLY